jgi:hypothetical protein
LTTRCRGVDEKLATNFLSNRLLHRQGRSVSHWLDVDDHRRRFGNAVTIGHRVVEFGDAAEIIIRVEDNPAVSDCHAAACRIADGREFEIAGLVAE